MTDLENKVFEAIYTRYRPFVFGIASRLLGNSCDAEEVTQDVFLEFWRHPPNAPHGSCSLMAWLASVTRSRCLRLLRSKRRVSMEDSFESTFVYSDATLDRILETRLRTQLESAFRHVSHDYRAVLELTYFHGMGPLEISVHLGLPLITVRRQINALIVQLRRRLTARPAFFTAS